MRTVRRRCALSAQIRDTCALNPDSDQRIWLLEAVKSAPRMFQGAINKVLLNCTADAADYVRVVMLSVQMSAWHINHPVLGA
jgi:hypothetical protein